MNRNSLRLPVMFSTMVLAACDNPADPTIDTTEPGGPQELSIPQLPLIRVNPFRTPAGGGDLVIEVDGLDFTNGSTVYWDGSPRTTAFVSDSQLSVTISASDLAPPGTVSITVVGSTGAATNPLPFFIDATEVQPRFAYLLNRPEGISAYRVDSETGTLDPIVGFRPPNVGGFERPFVSDPTGRFIYAGVYADGESTIAWFEVDRATGTLTYSGSLRSRLRKIAMDPAGQYVFALSGEELLAYTIDPSTGNLSDPPISRIATFRAVSLAVEPSGRFLYTTNGYRVSPPDIPPAGVHTFRFNRGTGELIHLSVQTTIGGPGGVAADRCGERLFVITQSTLIGGDLVAYNIDPLVGTLSQSTGMVGLTEPGGIIAVHPSCRSIYVTSRLVQAVTVDRGFSPLNQFESESHLHSMAMDPSGRFLYVGAANGSVHVLQLDSISGSMMLETRSSFEAGLVADAILVVP